jgi:hypothetical protein
MTIDQAKQLIADMFADCEKVVVAGGVAEVDQQKLVSMFARLGGKLSVIRGAIDAHLTSREAKGDAKTVADPPLAGRWHHGNGFLCCGTFRVAREDWEAGVCAAPGMRQKVLDWMCERLNAPAPAAQKAAKTDDWQQAIIEQAMVTECVSIEGREPLDILRDIISWHVALNKEAAKPVAHFIETSPGSWEQAASLYAGQPGVTPLYRRSAAQEAYCNRSDCPCGMEVADCRHKEFRNVAQDAA